MKIVIIGGTGNIGKSVTTLLKNTTDHEVIAVGFTGGDMQVNINDPASITNFFEKLGNFDALVSVTGQAKLVPLAESKETDFRVGLESKLLGQINLVLYGMKYINPGGSFTLTSGILSEVAIASGTTCTTVDAAVNGFVMTAAAELKNDVRINVVAPGVLASSPQLHSYFPGHIPVKDSDVSTAYLRSIFGPETGKIFRVY